MKYYLLGFKENITDANSFVYVKRKIRKPKVGDILKVKHSIISFKPKFTNNKIDLFVNVKSFSETHKNQIIVEIIKGIT